MCVQLVSEITAHQCEVISLKLKNLVREFIYATEDSKDLEYALALVPEKERQSLVDCFFTFFVTGAMHVADTESSFHVDKTLLENRRDLN